MWGHTTWGLCSRSGPCHIRLQLGYCIARHPQAFELDWQRLPTFPATLGTSKRRRPHLQAGEQAVTSHSGSVPVAIVHIRCGGEARDVEELLQHMQPSSKRATPVLVKQPGTCQIRGVS